MTFIDLSSSFPSSSTSAPASHDHMQHLLNIPNFSSLFLSSSTNPPTPRPVTPMNDINNNELDFLQLAHAALFLHSPPPAAAAVAAMAAAGEHTSHFVSAHEYADPYTSTPAMLQLLTALNGPGDHHQQLNLSASADPYAPATLNFFQGRHDASQSTTATLHHGASLLGATGAASFEPLDHNLLHLGQQQLPTGELHQVSGCSSGYLNLFSKEYLGCSFGEVNDNGRPPTTSTMTISGGAGAMSLNPYLQLQPLEIHPPLGSPPTLFQKRAAQRREAAPPTPSSSSTSSKLIVPASPARLNARAPCSFTTRLLHAADLSFREHMGASAERHQKDSTVKDLPSAMPQQELAHAKNDGIGDGQFGLLPNSDQDYELAAEDDENCQALFQMHDPELQRMDAVHGHESMQQLHEKAASCMADDDELLLVQSATDEALQLEAAASEQHISADCTANRGGRGKVKGPPAKNLMAERRRRKKLNDRLYTLRSVVPKISKMDRASILGDAIEYLKELLQRINDLHNELEASSGPAPMNSTAAITAGLPPAPPTPNSFTNQCSSLTPTSTTSVPGFVKLEEYCPSSASQLHLQCPDPSQPPKIEVRVREGRALNIHMLCGGTRPGLLLASMRALEGLGLDVQQAVISCFNGFALDVFRAEQSEEEEVAAEEVKRVLLHTAGSCYNSSACAVSSSY